MTCMLFSYTQDKFPDQYTPTVFDNYEVKVKVQEKTYTLALFDTAGQDDYDRMRSMVYPNTDVFLVCFSVARPDSLQNVKIKWLPELQQNPISKDVPFILVGTQIDLR